MSRLLWVAKLPFVREPTHHRYCRRSRALFHNIESGLQQKGVGNVYHPGLPWPSLGSRRTGTASDLLGALSGEISETARRAKAWPATPRVLSGRLRRAATFLRKIGIDISFDREGRARTRIIRISCMPDDWAERSSASSASSANSEKPAQGSPHDSEDADRADDADAKHAARSGGWRGRI